MAIWAWDEPDSAQLLVRLALDRVDDFLLDAAQPRLDALKRGGEIRYWTCVRMGLINAAEGRLLLHLRPTARVTAPALEARVRARLEDALREAGGSFLEALRDVMPQEYARERFGGDRGLRIFKLFERGNSTAVLGLLRALRRPAKAGGYELGLGSFFFFRETAGLSDGELLDGLDRWFEFFGPKVLPDPRELAAFAEQAARQIERDPGLRRLLERLTRAGWKKTLPPALRRPLLRHEASMRRVGRLLSANEPNFSPAKPKTTVFFHSYLHVHYMRLGFTGKKELFVVALLRAWLGAGREGPG